MPLTDEEKAQLDELLGTSQAAPPIPGTLPPEIAGVAYPASFTKGGLRVNIPPPASEVQRQMSVERMKQENKPVASTIQRDFSRIESFEGSLNDLEKLANEVPKGPLKGRYAGIGSKVVGGGEFPGVSEAQSIGAVTYNAMRPGIAAGLYRAVTGDDRISDMDAAQRALPFVPDLSLTPKAFQERLDLIRSAIRRRKESILKARKLGVEPPPGDLSLFSTTQKQPSTSSSSVQDGATATNPSTGEQIIYRNGAWQKK